MVILKLSAFDVFAINLGIVKDTDGQELENPNMKPMVFLNPEKDEADFTSSKFLYDAGNDHLYIAPRALKPWRDDDDIVKYWGPHHSQITDFAIKHMQNNGIEPSDYIIPGTVENNYLMTYLPDEAMAAIPEAAWRRLVKRLNNAGIDTYSHQYGQFGDNGRRLYWLENRV